MWFVWSMFGGIWFVWISIFCFSLFGILRGVGWGFLLVFGGFVGYLFSLV